MSDTTNNTTATDEIKDVEDLNQDNNEQDKNWKALREQAKKEREERKQLEAELEKYRKLEEEREKQELEKKGEYEKLIALEKEKLAKQQAKLLEDKLKAKMEAELIKNGANPDMAELLVDKAVKQAQLNEDGDVTNLDDIISSTKSTYSDIFKPVQKKTPPAQNPQGNVQGKLTKEQAIELLTGSKVNVGNIKGYTHQDLLDAINS